MMSYIPRFAALIRYSLTIHKALNGGHVVIPFPSGSWCTGVGVGEWVMGR